MAGAVTLDKPMKKLLLALLLFPVTTFAANTDDNPVFSNVTFCRAFAKKIRWGEPMKEVVKVAKAPGVEVSPNRWHWDGANNSYLNIQSYAGVVKSAIITCPDGSDIYIHVDAPSN